MIDENRLSEEFIYENEENYQHNLHYEGGEIRKSFYVNGLQEGIEKVFDKNGNLIEEHTYKRGRHTYYKRFINGKVSEESVMETGDRDMFETDDVRKLVVQLSENDYEISLSVDERIFAEFQLENNIGQENFDKGDDSELKNIDGYDPNKDTYTGKTLSREDESKVDKENLLKYLNEYIESEEFEEGSDLDSFCSWAVFEYGMSFEQDLILSYQEEVFYVEGENTMRASCYFMEEQRSYDLKIKI